MFKLKTRRQIERVILKAYREAWRLHRKGYGPDDIDSLQRPFRERMRKATSLRDYKKAFKRCGDLGCAKLMWGRA
jgi:hypothetical protein